MQKIILNLTIPETHANQRLDQALANLLPDYSRSQLQNWLESGEILVNGKMAKGKVKVKGNEVIDVTVTLIEQETWQAQSIPLDIVYEDDDVLVINKPVGLVVHPGAGNKASTLLNAILHHHKNANTLPRAGIIHRLDKNTSGLLLIGKTLTACRHLTLQLKKRAISREYEAIVYGKMISGGTVNAPIGRHPIERKRMSVSEMGKNAVTHYRVKEKFRAHTRLHVKLETGRTHQIRVHMSHIRHPIIGDNVYGGRVRLSKGMSSNLVEALRKFKRQALHASDIGFQHPVSKEMLHFNAPIPDDLQTLLQILRDDAKCN